MSVEIFPFSFREVMKAERQEVVKLGPRERARALRRCKEYLKQGGFPETLSVTRSLRRRLLQDYVDAVLLRDVIERYNPSDPLAIETAQPTNSASGVIKVKVAWLWMGKYATSNPWLCGKACSMSP